MIMQMQGNLFLEGVIAYWVVIIRHCLQLMLMMVADEFKLALRYMSIMETYSSK